MRTNSSKELFVEKIKNVKEKLLDRGYPEKLIQRTLSEVNFDNRKQALQQKRKKTNASCLL